MTAPEVATRVGRERDVTKVLEMLQHQHVAKRDFTVPSNQLLFGKAALNVAGQEVVIKEDGVTDVNGVYELSNHAIGQLAEIFKVPVKYLRRIRDEVNSGTATSGLFDANLNAWAGVDSRSFLVRGMIGDEGNYVRAILSDTFALSMENIDVLMAVLSGLTAVELEDGTHLGPKNIRDIQITESRLYIRVEAPEITALGGEYVKGLKSPYQGTGHGGVTADHPELVHAGFVVTNSEIGAGALNATGEVIAKVCDNGATMKDSRIRKVHVGGKLDEGVQWQADTVEAQEKVTMLMVRDAFAKFLTKDWLEESVNTINRDAGFEVQDIQKTIEVVSNELQFSKDEQANIMKMFFDGGQRTSGGVANAITAAAQNLEDADRANYFSEVAIDAMKIAAKV